MCVRVCAHLPFTPGTRVPRPSATPASFVDGWGDYYKRRQEAKGGGTAGRPPRPKLLTDLKVQRIVSKGAPGWHAGEGRVGIHYVGRGSLTVVRARRTRTGAPTTCARRGDAARCSRGAFPLLPLHPLIITLPPNTRTSSAAPPPPTLRHLPRHACLPAGPNTRFTVGMVVSVKDGLVPASVVGTDVAAPGLGADGGPGLGGVQGAALIAAPAWLSPVSALPRWPPAAGCGGCLFN
jgi:hypothetical protein